MEHDKKLIEKIAIEVQTEYEMGGLADGLYLDFATDVAIRYANAVLPQAAVSGAERKVCPKCSDFGKIDNLDGTISTCPCHY